MIKTQIQLPDELYRQVKQLAEAKQWSLAETLRRGAELLLNIYPDARHRGEPWSPPKPRRLGWQGLSHEEVRSAGLDDIERAGQQ